MGVDQIPIMTEKLCLKWNDFQENVSSAFGSLRDDIDFSDVTLAGEDGQQVEAHKVILAASSPFFKNLLKRNKHPHPLIYMRGVKSEDLVAIVDFLYYGEANVYQENIEAFLALAEELNLQGLTGNTNKNTEEEVVLKPDERKKKIKSKQNIPKNNLFEQSIPYPNEIIPEENPMEELSEETERAVAIANTGLMKVITDVQELDEQVKLLITKSQNRTSDGTKMACVCTVCGKEGHSNNIKDHIEANHLEGISIPCNFCEKTFRSRSGLRQHLKRGHT